MHQMRKYLTVCSWVLKVKMEHLSLQYFLTLVMLEMRMFLWRSFFIIFSKFNVHRRENLMYRNELNGLRLNKLNTFKKRLELISK